MFSHTLHCLMVAPQQNHLHISPEEVQHDVGVAGLERAHHLNKSEHYLQKLRSEKHEVGFSVRQNSCFTLDVLSVIVQSVNCSQSGFTNC